MALFAYKGFARDGGKKSGQVEAPSEGGARELLKRQGVYPTSLMPVHKISNNQGMFARFFQTKVPLKDVLLFTQQLAVLLRSGVPLLQAIELLTEQFTGQLHTILISIKDGIQEGHSLAEGLKQYPAVFENIYVQLVRAGEASGNLEIILNRLVVYLKARDEMKKRISSALRNPLIQLGLIFIVTIFLLTSVVPQMAETFASGGVDLPVPTQILMAISNFMLNHYILLVLLVIGIVATFSYWSNTENGAHTIDRIKLRLPLVSTFAQLGAVAQFCSTLGMLIEGGVRLSDALDIVCNIVDNSVLKKALLEARDNIIKQGKIAQYLKKTKVFPPIAIYLIATGEESGNLDEMLLEVAKNYEDELSEKADNLSAALGPFVTVLLGLIVGFIVLAIALPMTQMSGALT
ncbi:type II secretion system F family protein [Candidatus Babeliales bacterium]|nr:type II secretion system F family protein [Candidatus Babeliales bacterium]